MLKFRLLRKRIPVLVLAAFSASAIFACSAFAGPLVTDLDSGAAPGSGFIAVDELFEAKDGQVRELVMTGLKEGNKDQMIRCLEDNYREAGETQALKIIDSAFCDAEKFDNTDEHAYYDSLQCWAASAANMLWISGWTDHLDDKEGLPFSSEDEIFQLYNSRFTDRGGDIDKAIDWFFMGEFFVTGTEKSAALLVPLAEDGFLNAFVSSFAQAGFDLTEDPSDIRQLLRIGPEKEGLQQGQSVFQGSVGSLLGGKLIDSWHSVTIAGVVIDPEASAPGDQFRAVIIIDSDNDGEANEEEFARVNSLISDNEAAQDAMRAAEKAKIKAERPNSYTLYPLRCISDAEGKACWEIVGYSDPEEEYWEPEILYSISELMLPSDDLIESLWEKDGSLDHVNDPDLTLDILFMTGDPEGFTNPYLGRINDEENAKVTEFAYGAAVRLNYFVSNRSLKSIEQGTDDDERPSLTWKVTRDSDGTVAAQGTHLCELPILAGYEGGSEKANLITVNEYYGQILPLEPGEYTLTAELNSCRKVKEAYYTNNIPRTLKFSIIDPPRHTRMDNITKRD